MKRYDTYKDSNVLWIGEIPNTWNIVKFNHFVFLKHGYQFRDYDFTQTGLKIIKITQLKSNGELETEKVSYIDEKRLENFENILINEGDILMALTGGTIGKIIKVKEVNEPLLQNYRVGNFFPSNNKLEKSFLFWILSSNYILAQIFFDQRETGQPNIGKENFGRMFLTLPKTITEQTQIANYLNQKTSELDELIKQKGNLLNVYEEEKTAIINQAVTKGINPKVKLKDSGVDWLGQIPEHWEVKKMKYVSELNSETLPDKTDDNYQLEYIDIGNVEYGKLKEKPKKMSFKEAPSRAKRIVKSGDTLISTVRTYLKAILFIESANDCLIASTGFAVITPNNSFFPNYLFYVLSSEVFLQNITANSVGVSYPAINASEISTFYSWFPAKEEQTQIVNYIETETTKINTKVTNTKKLIALLKEYKTALISEVVTGKIKVN